MTSKKFVIPEEGFRPCAIRINNFKGLREVELSFDGNDRIYEFTGGNGQGKTSAIEAFTYLLFGKKFLPKEPIRHGADKLEVLGDLGAVTVYRSFDRAGKQEFRILPKDGSDVRSTEEVAKELFGQIAINASAFKYKSDNEQFDHLLNILPLEIDLRELEERRKAIFETRTKANQEVSNYKAQLELYCDLPSTKPESVDVSALNEQRRRRMPADEGHRNAEKAVEDHKKLLESGETRLEQMRADLKAAEAKQEERRAKLPELEGDVNDYWCDQENLPSLEEIDKKAETAAESNDSVLKWNARESLREQHNDWTERSKELTSKLEEIDAEKKQALAGCDMPYPDLEIDLENKVLRLKGTRLKEASDSEQLLVSAAVGMTAETNLHAIHVKGDELDNNSRALLYKMADAMDFYVLSDRCDTSGEIGIVIKEGEVVAENPQFHPQEDVFANA